MSFRGTRRGFRVGRHAQLKSDDWLKRKLKRICRQLNRGSNVDQNAVKEANIYGGILRGRGHCPADLWT